MSVLKELIKFLYIIAWNVHLRTPLELVVSEMVSQTLQPRETNSLISSSLQGVLALKCHVRAIVKIPGDKVLQEAVYRHKDYLIQTPIKQSIKTGQQLSIIPFKKKWLLFGKHLNIRSGSRYKTRMISSTP